MKESLNPGLFHFLIDFLKRTEEYHLKAQYQFSSELRDDFLDICEVRSEAVSVYKHILENYGRIHELREVLEQYFEQHQQNAADGKNSINGIDYSIAMYGELLAANSNKRADYSKYKHAQEYLNREKTFTQEYQEMQAYFDSDEFMSSMNRTDASEYTNYKLMWYGIHDALFSRFDHEYKLDKYTDGIIASALKGIVENIPDIMPRFKTEDDMYAYFDEKYGTKNTKKFISAVKQYLKQTAAMGESAKLDIFDPNTLKELGNDPFFVEYIKKEGLIEFLDKDVYGSLGKVFTKMGDIASGIGKVQDVAEGIDLLVESALILTANYDAQAQYLTAMRDALSSVGMYQGTIEKVVDDCIAQYSSNERAVMKKVADFAEGKFDGGMADGVIGALNEYLPGLKMANIMLGTVDKYYDLKYKEEISAQKTLSGCLAYDRSLSATYDHYIDMMKAGVATEEDMERAEVIYDILIATKKKERDAYDTLHPNSVRDIGKKVSESIDSTLHPNMVTDIRKKVSKVIDSNLQEIAENKEVIHKEDFLPHGRGGGRF